MLGSHAMGVGSATLSKRRNKRRKVPLGIIIADPSCGYCVAYKAALFGDSIQIHQREAAIYARTELVGGCPSKQLGSTRREQRSVLKVRGRLRSRRYCDFVGRERAFQALNAVIEISGRANDLNRSRRIALMVEGVGYAQHTRAVNGALGVALEPVMLGCFGKRERKRLPLVRS